MSQLIDSYKQKVKPYQKIIVLPEGEDIRVIGAASEIAKEGFVKIVVLGDEKQIAENAKGCDLSGVEIINPKTSPRLQEYADFLYELRKEKGVTPEKALELVSDVMYYAVMMVKCGHADGMVGGAIHATSDLLRPALQIVKTVKGVKTVSGFFIMENASHPDEKLRQIIFLNIQMSGSHQRIIVYHISQRVNQIIQHQIQTQKFIGFRRNILRIYRTVFFTDLMGLCQHQRTRTRCGVINSHILHITLHHNSCNNIRNGMRRIVLRVFTKILIVIFIFSFC